MSWIWSHEATEEERVYGKSGGYWDWPSIFEVSMYGNALREMTGNFRTAADNVLMVNKIYHIDEEYYNYHKDDEWPPWKAFYAFIENHYISSKGHYDRLNNYLDAESVHVSEARNDAETDILLDNDIDVVDSIIHSLSNAAKAGTVPVTPTLAASEGRKRLWSISDMSGLIDRLAEQEVRIAAALPQMRVLVNEWRALESDTGARLVDKEVAYKALAAKLQAATPQYGTNLKKLIGEYDGHALPDDLGTMRRVLVERLEAAATGHQKRLKSAITQQAIDNWAACVDMDTAMSNVAYHCVLGSRAIGKADDTIWKRVGGAWEKSSFADFLMGLPAGQQTPDADVEHAGEGDPDAALGTDGEFYRDTASGIAEAKATFEKFKAEIEAVTAANTPRWVVNGTAVDEPFPARQSVSGRTLTVRAVQPTGVNIQGDVDIVPVPVVTYLATGNPAPVMRTVRRPADPLEHEAVIILPPAVTDPVLVVVHAANLCGPSKIEIVVTP